MLNLSIFFARKYKMYQQFKENTLFVYVVKLKADQTYGENQLVFTGVVTSIT